MLKKSFPRLTANERKPLRFVSVADEREEICGSDGNRNPTAHLIGMRSSQTHLASTGSPNPTEVDSPRAVAAALKRRRATLPKEPNAKLRGDELLPGDSGWITHTEGKLDVNYCKSLERGGE